jgi:hypothetical protein
MKWSKPKGKAGSIEAALAAVEFKSMKHMKQVVANSESCFFPQEGWRPALALIVLKGR